MDVKTKAELEEAVRDGKALVDFWATWCGPCQMMGQRIAGELVPKMPGLKVVKVNVDEAQELAAQFGIMSIPALFCYRDGARVAEFVGVTDVADIMKALD